MYNKNKTTHVPTPKLVERPVVFYNRPSVEGAIEYGSNKRELHSLLKGAILAPKEVKILQLEEKILKMKAATAALFKKARVMRLREKAVSYAAVARVGAEPTMKWSATPVVVKPDLTRSQARRDYTRAFEEMQKQRKAAFELVKAMAARRPRRVFRERESITLARAQELREQMRVFRRERNFVKKHPAREVRSFPLGCEWVYPIVEDISLPCEEMLKRKASPTSVKQVKKCSKNRFATSEAYVSNEKQRRRLVAPCDLDPEYIAYLKFKIRMCILRFRNLERFWSLVDRVLSRQEQPEGQMDQAGEVQSKVQSVDSASNVVIQSAATDETGVAHSVTPGFRELAISREKAQVKQSFSTFTDRWLKIGQADWTTVHKTGDTIVEFSLPGTLYKHANAQMLQVLFVNRFVRFDMEFKVVLNSSPWQVGLAVVHWCYPTGSNSPALSSVYSGLQRNHAKLSAGSSNNVVLNVPYHLYNSFIVPTEKAVSLGMLRISVLNSLSVVDKVATKASLTVYVALKNIEAHGLISRSLGYVKGVHEGQIPEGQMEDIARLCNVGSNVLRTAGQIFNADKPPLPLQPVCLVPQTTTSFCYTDGIVEPVNVLRADPRGQRPGRFDGREMSLEFLRHGWGYLKTLEWSFSDTPGTTLTGGGIRVIPLDRIANYGATQFKDQTRSCVFPPVAVLASMASKWRGDLEFEFEVVANSFYTGSLTISMVPFDRENIDRSAEVVLQSATVVLDIQKTSKLRVTAPWNWVNAWADTPGLFELDGDAIARLYVKVMNNLVGIDSVPTKIYINVYVRGGVNFEVCQYRTPLLAKDGEIFKPPDTEYLRLYNFETALYATWNKDIAYGDNWFVALYIQNVSAGWEGFLNVEEFKIYQLEDVTNKNRGFQVWYRFKGTDQTKYIKYGLYHPGLSSRNARGLIVSADLSELKKARDTFKANRTYERKSDVLDACTSLFWDGTDGIWSKIYNGKEWITADNQAGEHPVWTLVVEDTVMNNEIDPQVQAQMNKEGTSVTIEAPSPATGFGKVVYGESMPDLKGMARRWQHMGSVVANTCVSKYPRDCGYFCRFPVSPQRYPEIVSSYCYDNRLRSGSIEMLSQMFAYWDGGMRYRFVVNHSVPDDTVIYVQHRFDAIPTDMKIQYGGDVKSTKDLMDTHYPTFAQSLNINPVVTVEAPYMHQCERLVTSIDPELGANGMIYVYIHSPKSVEVHLEVYYSVADDFQWSVFQGSPYFVDIREVPDEPKVEAQMDERPSLKPYFQDESDDEGVCSQGFLSGLASAVTGTMLPAEDRLNTSLTKLDNAADILSGSGKTVAESFTKLSDKLQGFVDTVSDVPSKLSQAQKDRVERGHLSSFLSDLKGASFDYLTHLIYCVISPTGKTIGWALVNLYRNVFGFSLDGITSLTESVGNLWTRVTQPTKQPQVEGQMEDTDISSLCSLLYCSLCTLLRLKMKPPTTWGNISAGLFEFGGSCRNGTFVSNFFKDNLELLKRIWNKILSLFSCNSKNYKLIAGIEDDRLKQWCVHSTAILNPSLRDKLRVNPIWAQKVFELAVVGRGINLALHQGARGNGALVRLVADNLKELIKLEQELVNRNIYCGERYEPFCLWVHGGAGVGKTRFLQTVATSLAREQGDTNPQTYHTMTFQQQYFDGYVGQSSVLFDDFLATSPVTDPAVQMFIQMKSSALFNPPYAVCEDKSKLVNFMNLLVSSNFASVRNLPGVHDETAYNRRRDLVLVMKARPNAPVKSTDEEKLIEQYTTLEFVEVGYYPDPLKTDDPIMIKRVLNEKYSETVLNFIMERARTYHKLETCNFRKRVQEKIQRLNMVEADSVESYLTKATECFVSSKDFVDKQSLFDFWSKPQVGIAELFDAPLAVVEGQADEGVRIDDRSWPDITIDSSVHTQVDEYEEGKVVEPISRICYAQWPKLSTNTCLHRLVKDVKAYHYDRSLGCFMHKVSSGKDLSDTPYSFPIDCCKIVKDGGLIDMPDCIMNDPIRAYELKTRFMTDFLFLNPELSARWPEYEFEEVREMEMPIQWVREIAVKQRVQVSRMRLAADNSILLKRVEAMQRQLADRNVMVGEAILPRKSRFRQFTDSVWSAFLTVCKWVYRAFLALERILAFLALLGMCSIFGSALIGAATMSGVEGNIHPSGDFKTMKAKANTRTKAFTLAKGQNLENGAFYDDKEIKDGCRRKMDPSVRGRFDKIVNNVFTLVGIAPYNETQEMQYRVRCIGLKDRKFLMLSHYLDFFKTKGVYRVAVCYHGGKGVQRFNLDEIEWEWGPQGYGIGIFPTLARPFSNIVKFMPSETFDGNYPYNMWMVEVHIDDIYVYHLDCKKLRKPLVVAKTSSHESWTIEQGLQYEWGGKGKCGSFLFAPEMACPFVGVHTAGIDSKIGYAEILLRETFEDKQDRVVDFVTPQMDYREGGFDLPDDGLVLGHLEPSKAVSMPTKTKIRPSMIAGVFPIKTEPAPLHWSDDRIQHDPLVEGIRKRCLRPKEFPKEVVAVAVEDYREKMLTVVKPVRDPGVLSVKEAVEGCLLPGYEPLKISTSEGYPWVLNRPSGCSDKSWLFKFSEYPDGRRCLEGVDRQLMLTLEGKQKMRERGVVPATYYTACLKDARIKVEKVKKPGATRVFEMSPVDLTIAQRQYFMDFYVSYETARFKAENTIGINPDGREWSLLAKMLTDFSPFILTADYSGYGPRLLQSIQEKAYGIEIEWYSEHAVEDTPALTTARWALAYETLYPLNVVKDAVVCFNTGMPSGNAATVIKNSECNSLYIRIVYLLLAQEFSPQHADMYWFDKFVLMFSNGDDLIMSVKEDIIGWFNNQTLISKFAEYDIKMTDALKSDGEVRPYCQIEEATYLKRGFLKHPDRQGEWLAPLEEDSITDTANWIWRCVDERAASLVNTEMCARLAYTRGPAFYNKIVKSLIGAWRKYGVDFKAPSWNSLDMHVWEGTEGPLFSF